MKHIYVRSAEHASTMVDDGDYIYLNSFTWCLNGSGYVFGNKGFMHRVITGLDHHKGKMEVDHINGNKLDNRRENLRICTHAENMYNLKKDKAKNKPLSE